MSDIDTGYKILILLQIYCGGIPMGGKGGGTGGEQWEWDGRGAVGGCCAVVITAAKQPSQAIHILDPTTPTPTPSPSPHC